MARPVLMRLDETLQYVHMKRSTLYRHMSLGDFPRPIKLGPRLVAWMQKDLDRWLDQQIKLSRS